SRGAQVRLGHDLDERNAGAVEVDVGPARRVNKAFVQRLGGVFLEVDAGDAPLFEAAARRQRQLVLRDLVALRQVGIEVVLAREDRRLVDRAAERQRGANGV